MSLDSFKEQAIKYKLYHIPFWFGYHLIWLTFNIGSLEKVGDYLFFSVVSIKFYFYVIFQIIGVYFNLYYLIPKLLYTRQYKTYILAVLMVILTCTTFITCGYYVVASISNLTFFELFNLYPEQFFSVFLIQALPSTAASMTLAMSVKLGKNWLETEKRRLNLEKENLETELKYLKSQINPHFLFNTINSIFALIHRNPDLASESLANFSDMLRYQLYECNDEEIELKKELLFLESFIDLEKLRLDEKQIEIESNIVNKTTNGQKIVPLILVPFIENAFKHVSKGKQQNNFISVDIKAQEKLLFFNIKNSVHNSTIKTTTNNVNGGIGLKNVKRRLDLLYGNKHQLQINASKKKFSVALKIELE